jgi:hypothetical protein
LDDNQLRALMLKREPDYKSDYSSLSAPLEEGHTHFKLSFKINQGSVEQIYNLFANMTEEEDKLDPGEVKKLGQFHFASFGKSFAICSAKSAVDLMAWAMKWASGGEITIEPILDDATVQKILKEKPGYDKKLEALMASM